MCSVVSSASVTLVGHSIVDEPASVQPLTDVTTGLAKDTKPVVPCSLEHAVDVALTSTSSPPCDSGSVQFNVTFLGPNIGEGEGDVPSSVGAVEGAADGADVGLVTTTRGHGSPPTVNVVVAPCLSTVTERIVSPSVGQPSTCVVLLMAFPQPVIFTIFGGEHGMQPVASSFGPRDAAQGTQ